MARKRNSNRDKPTLWRWALAENLVPIVLGGSIIKHRGRKPMLVAILSDSIGLAASACIIR